MSRIRYVVAWCWLRLFPVALVALFAGCSARTPEGYELSIGGGSQVGTVAASAASVAESIADYAIRKHGTLDAAWEACGTAMDDLEARRVAKAGAVAGVLANAAEAEGELR